MIQLSKRKSPEERLGECVREMGIPAAEKHFQFLKGYDGAEKKSAKAPAAKTSAAKAATTGGKTDAP